MQFWETGWQTLFASVEPLTVDDFEKSVTIRGEAHTVVEAINRQLTHYSSHVGQIVFLAKHLKVSEWQNLSIPRKQSAQFNQFLADKQSTGQTKLDRIDAAAEFTGGINQKGEPV